MVVQLLIQLKEISQLSQWGSQNKDVKLLDKELSKLENFSKHSPDVGTYNVEKTSLGGPKYSISKNIKFQQPKHQTDLKMNLPVSYLGNKSYRDRKSSNFSISNLPKQKRFRFREVAERQMEHLAGPASYNLSGVFSIEDKTKNDVITNVRQRRMMKLTQSFSRFKDSSYYPEKERLLKGTNSVSPDKYDPIPAYKAIRVRRGYQAKFSKQNRGLEPKKEKKESPSPTKYHIKTEEDIKFTQVPKGAPIGLSKRRMEFKVPTY